MKSGRGLPHSKTCRSFDDCFQREASWNAAVLCRFRWPYLRSVLANRSKRSSPFSIFAMLVA